MPRALIWLQVPNAYMMLLEPQFSWMPTRGRRDPFAGLQTGVTLNWVIGDDQQVPDIRHADVVLISVLLGIYFVCMLGPP